MPFGLDTMSVIVGVLLGWFVAPFLLGLLMTLFAKAGGGAKPKGV